MIKAWHRSAQLATGHSAGHRRAGQGLARGKTLKEGPGQGAVVDIAGAGAVHHSTWMPGGKPHGLSTLFTHNGAASAQIMRMG